MARIMNTKIEIRQGHNDVAGTIEWQGTVREYWEANPDLTLGDISDLKADLLGYGAHRVGGGAAGCFTVFLAKGE